MEDKKRDWRKNYNPAAQTKANRKYREKHERQVGLSFNTDTDADILEKLDSVSSKMGYIKNLIREDIKKSG